MKLATDSRLISSTADSLDLDASGSQQHLERHRIFKYLVVGSVGFLIDAGLLALQVHLLGIGPLIARGPSFLSAVIVTWWLNREHTFGGLRRYSAANEYRRYFAIQVVGALTNFAAYAVAISSVVWFAKYPVAAVAIGAILGLMVNYRLARLYVFPGVRR